MEKEKKKAGETVIIILTAGRKKLQTHTLSLKSNKRRYRKGVAMVIAQAVQKKVNSTLQATGPDPRPAILTLKTNH